MNVNLSGMDRMNWMDDHLYPPERPILAAADDAGVANIVHLSSVTHRYAAIPDGGARCKSRLVLTHRESLKVVLRFQIVKGSELKLVSNVAVFKCNNLHAPATRRQEISHLVGSRVVRRHQARQRDLRVRVSTPVGVPPPPSPLPGGCIK